MSDKLYPLPIERLLQITFRELDDKGTYFGIPASLFFDPTREIQAEHDGTGRKDASSPALSPTVFRSELFGKKLHTPLGVAAGPHSQMAQNIVAAWLLGARYMELKTVQTLDELEVPKPCISIQDEGYNCEWSQELKIRQSAHEYLNAWIIIHVLNHRFGWGRDPGVIFNLSVGYNMEGILKDNVQWFFAQMKDSSQALAEKIERIRPIYPSIGEVDIPGRISDNVTLSTMHGCPAHEIEEIAGYLMAEKGLHTYVKLNPTLLGPEPLRKILNEQLGFRTHVPDQAFEHDLKYPDALRILENLQRIAGERQLEFGLKLSNTLESQNKGDVFASGVEQMYMSGRALHPLTVSLADRLQGDFRGQLKLSFSGGADAFNLAELLACGFQSVTTCTDLLKPGGMMRLPQYLQRLAGQMHELKAGSLDELVLAKARAITASAGRKQAAEQAKPPEKAGYREAVREAANMNLALYTRRVLDDKRYRMEALHVPGIKTKRTLEAFDCISAPCRDSCATRQDIPEYMYHSARGEFKRAHGVILQTNPFPRVTGMICDHLCQNKCTRVHYDDPLLIREVKRFNSMQEAPPLQPAPSNGLNVSVIGAGPAGLSCAYFLALAGFSVTAYERASKAGGMVQYAIPGFRLTDEAMDSDLARIRSLGVRIEYETDVDEAFFKDLRATSDFVFVGTGAPISTPLEIEGMEAEGVLDPLDFLFKARAGERRQLGQRVVIIGGGNTAMDAARTASRLIGEDGRVSIVYRRTIQEMPADQGEIRAALEEGVQFLELCAPGRLITEEGRLRALRCHRMELGEPDSSGRPRPQKIEGSAFELECDTLIPAIGQLVRTGFMDETKLATRQGSYLSREDKVFTGGDAMRGAATAIKAIGDGRRAALEIMDAAGINHQNGRMKKDTKHGAGEIMLKRARRSFAPHVQELPLAERKQFALVQSPLGQEDIQREASRCLHCDELCNSCVTVCPNLANYPVHIKPLSLALEKAVRTGNGGYQAGEDGRFEVLQEVQILNIADFCNECGNCRTFCPTADAPYQVKPRIHLNKSSFDESENGYYLWQADRPGRLSGKEGNNSRVLPEKEENEMYGRPGKKGDSHPTLFWKEGGKLYTLSEREGDYLFESDSVRLILDREGLRIRDVRFLKEAVREASTRKAAEMLAVLACIRELPSA